MHGRGLLWEERQPTKDYREKTVGKDRHYQTKSSEILTQECTHGSQNPLAGTKALGFHVMTK